MDDRPGPAAVAAKLWSERFGAARAVFCAGSVARGEGTDHSDLDIVVIFEHVPTARRESIMVEGWPVELFIHDLETLAYFVEGDIRNRRPSLAMMLAEGIVVPRRSAFSDELQGWARRRLENAPPVAARTMTDDRYFISDLLDDLRDRRPRAEVVATAARLHPMVGEFILKAAGRWSGSGKHLPRMLKSLDSGVADAFNEAFDAAFQRADVEALIRYVEGVLEPFGGPLFDGYGSDAPLEARADKPLLA